MILPAKFEYNLFFFIESSFLNILISVLDSTPLLLASAAVQRTVLNAWQNLKGAQIPPVSTPRH